MQPRVNKHGLPVLAVTKRPKRSQPIDIQLACYAEHMWSRRMLAEQGLYKREKQKGTNHETHQLTSQRN